MEIGAFLCDFMYEKDMEKYGFKTVFDAIRVGVEHGITAIDLPCSMYLTNGRFNPEELRDGIERAGAHISSAHAVVRCDYTSDDSVNKGVSELKNAMELAKRAGAPNFMMVFLPIDDSDYSIKEQFKAQVRRVMPELTAYAEQVGITPTIEDYSALLYPYATFEDIGWLLEHNPSLRFNYDSGNFPLAFADELEGARLFADKTTHVHLKDLVKSKESGLFLRGDTYYDSVVLGEGYLKNREALTCLKNAGYNGAVIIEICPVDDYMLEGVLKSAEYLKRVFAEL